MERFVRSLFCADDRFLPIAGTPTWARLAAVCAIAFGAMVTWSRIGVALHEVLGHALVWTVQGGTVADIDVTLFGGGRVRTAGAAAPGSSRFLFEMSGIFVNGGLGLALGVGALFLLRSRGGASHRVLSHFVAWGAVLNLAGATHYAAIGSFYGYGDAGAYPGVWPPALVLSVLTTPAAILLWSHSLVPIALVERARADDRRRFRPGAPGLVATIVPLAVYATALYAEQAVSSDRTEFATLRAERVAIARAIAAERRARIEAWRRAHPGEPVPPGLLDLSEADVERPFPFLACVLILDAVFLLAVVLLPVSTGPTRGVVSLSWHGWSWPLVGGAVALGTCALFF
jgi:hypothetical protein